jgi:hypothetical protein
MPFNIYIQVRAPKIDADEKYFLHYTIKIAFTKDIPPLGGFSSFS